MLKIKKKKKKKEKIVQVQFSKIRRIHSYAETTDIIFPKTGNSSQGRLKETRKTTARENFREKTCPVESKMKRGTEFPREEISSSLVFEEIYFRAKVAEGRRGKLERCIIIKEERGRNYGGEG